MWVTTNELSFFLSYFFWIRFCFVLCMSLSIKNILKFFGFLVVFLTVCYIAKKNETELSKVKRVSFSGSTFIKMNNITTQLNLEKENNEIHPRLILSLKEHALKTVGSVFHDKKNQLTVAITQPENESDSNHYVFAILKNNQLTQIQKISEITNDQITLQYGKVILNSKRTAELKDSSGSL